jgi:flagellar L-ring protein precursor FlgH
MRPLAHTFLAVAVVVASASGVSAGSIWAKAEARGDLAVRVYQDDAARQVGDILTIVIDEHSVIENETTREGEKDSSRSISASGTINLEDIYQWWSKQPGTFTMPTISGTSDASSEFEGTAGYESDRSMADEITVTVQDVLPNGNLVVLGCRERNVEGDTQIVQISGIVRPSDITFANTVSSEKVADFRMVVSVTGAEQHWTKPGWLGRILNWLSPW